MLEVKLKNLIKISHKIGERSDYAQGGGGNTSVKIDEDRMVIKASGYLLKDMTEDDGYVCLDYKKIVEVIKNIKEKNEEEENNMINFVMSKRIELDNNIKLLRPSIEVGFHALLDKYVIHSHSVYSNIINCSVEGKELLKNILQEEEYIFVEYTSPGLGLTLSVRDRIEEHKIKFYKFPVFVFLENHGLVVNCDTVDKVIEKHELVNKKIKKYFEKIEEYPNICINEKFQSTNKYILDFVTKYFKNKEILNFERVLFPDQVVYFKENICFEKNEKKKINMDLTKKTITYNVKTMVEAISVEETLLSYIYILSQILKNNLTPKYIGEKEQNYISNMKSEQYRKELMEKGGK